MKKVLAIMLCTILLLVCTSCTNTPENAETAEPIKYENLCIDIGVNEDGYYGLMSDVDIHYGEDGSIDWIYLDDPVVLAFKVSSEWDGGVYLLKQSVGNSAIDTLAEVSTELRDSGNNDLATRIDAVISIIGNAGPITGAST